MQKFSLQFLGREVETQYRKMLFKTTCKSIKRNFSVLTLLTFAWLIANIIRYHIFNQSTLVPLCLFIIIASITLTFNRIPKLLDYVLFMFQLCINMIWVICYVLNLNTGYFKAENSYYLGYVISYITQCYNIGSRTNLKLITILVNTIQMITIIFLDMKTFTFITVLVVCSGAMSMYHIYQDDRCRRQAYLVQIQQEQWEQNLDEVAEIGLIQCTFDKKNLSLRLHKANEISQNQFLIKDQISFLDFTRKLNLSLPQNFRLISEQKIKLEQLLFYIFTDFDKSSPLVNSFKSMDAKYGSCSFQAKGILNQTNYKVQIFQFWKKEQITVISISKFEDNLEIKTMKCKLQICQMAINSYQQQIQETIVPAIALLTKLRYMQEQRKQLPLLLKQVLSNLFVHSQYKLYESYRKNINILMFFNPRFQLKHQIFEPAQAIQNAIKILEFQIKSKNFRIITEQAPEQLKIKSSYQLFHQLILNILAQIMKVSKGNGDIFILHHPGKKDNQSQNSQCIEFTISTNATQANDLLINQIWVMNPLSLKNCKKVCYTKELNINLCVSHYIVGLLGPYSKIEYIQDELMCKIEFKIYQNLQDIKSFQRGNEKDQQNVCQSVSNSMNDSSIPIKNYKSESSVLKTVFNNPQFSQCE